jgi:hypothetical protein
MLVKSSWSQAVPTSRDRPHPRARARLLPPRQVQRALVVARGGPK